MNLWLLGAIGWTICLVLDCIEEKHNHSFQLIISHSILAMLNFYNYLGA